MKFTPALAFGLAEIAIEAIDGFVKKGEVTMEKAAEIKAKFDSVGSDWDAAVEKAKASQQ